MWYWRIPWYPFKQFQHTMQSQRWYIYKTFRSDIPPASSVTKYILAVTIATENVDLSVKSIKSTFSAAIVTLYTSFVTDEAEEYPSETSCKYTNVVTGVLELIERMNTRSGSLKSNPMILESPQRACGSCKKKKKVETPNTSQKQWTQLVYFQRCRRQHCQLGLRLDAVAAQAVNG